jgi:hypothetical protein
MLAHHSKFDSTLFHNIQDYFLSFSLWFMHTQSRLDSKKLKASFKET